MYWTHGIRLRYDVNYTLYILTHLFFFPLQISYYKNPSATIVTYSLLQMTSVNKIYLRKQIQCYNAGQAYIFSASKPRRAMLKILYILIFLLGCCEKLIESEYNLDVFKIRVDKLFLAGWLETAYSYAYSVTVRSIRILDRIIT